MSEADKSNEDVNFQAPGGETLGEVGAADSIPVFDNASRFYGGPFDAPLWMLDVAHLLKAQRLLSEEGSVFRKEPQELADEPPQS